MFNSNAGLPDLIGIDSKVGLNITQGDINLYIKLLGKFKKNHKDFSVDFKKAQNADDSNAAIRLVHTLKSTAASMGAIGVQDTAAALELALEKKGDMETILTLVQDVEHQLKPVITGLLQLDAYETPQKLPENHSTKDLAPAKVQQLQELLEQNNAEATSKVQDLLKLSPSPAHFELLQQAQQAISEYNFELALAPIKILLEEIDH